MMPGITVEPLMSRTRAPAGTGTDAAGPTAAILPARSSTVWSVFGAAPVPSTSRTCVNATSDVSTVMYSRTPAARESGRWAMSASSKGTTCMGASSIHGEMHHHPGREMLGDMTVQHPFAGISGIEENIHHRTGGHQNGVFPREIVIRHAIHRQNEKTLAVKMNRMLRAMKRAALVDEPNLDGLAAVEVPRDVQ